jgi:hypothetical protein
MQSKTLFLARFMGVFAIFEAGWMILRRDEALGLIHALLQDRVLGFAWGVFTAAAGFAVVIGHNAWRGGVLPVVVTLFGWILLIKGAALQVLVPDIWQQFLAAVHFEANYDVFLAVPLVLGLYLAIAGFLSRPTKA